MSASLGSKLVRSAESIFMRNVKPNRLTPLASFFQRGISTSAASEFDAREEIDVRASFVNAGIPIETESSVKATVNTALELQGGATSTSDDEFSSCVQAAASAGGIKLKRTVKSHLSQLEINDTLKESIMQDPYLLAAGGVDSGLIPGGRFEKCNLEKGGLSKKDAIKAMISSMEIWPSEHYTQKGSYFAQIGQVNGANNDLLKCPLSKKDTIFYICKSEGARTIKFPGVGDGHIFPEDKKIKMKAVIYCDEAGQLKTNGPKDLTDKLKVGLALNQMQRAALKAIILQSMLIHVENGGEVTGPIENNLAAAKAFLADENAYMALPTSTNDKTAKCYRECKKAGGRAKLQKVVDSLTTLLENRKASEAEAKAQAAAKAAAEAAAKAAGPQIDMDIVPAAAKQNAELIYPYLSLEDGILKVYKDNGLEPPMKPASGSTPFMDAAADVDNGATEDNDPGVVIE